MSRSSWEWQGARHDWQTFSSCIQNFEAAIKSDFGSVLASLGISGHTWMDPDFALNRCHFGSGSLAEQREEPFLSGPGLIPTAWLHLQPNFGIGQPLPGRRGVGGSDGTTRLRWHRAGRVWQVLVQVSGHIGSKSHNRSVAYLMLVCSYFSALMDFRFGPFHSAFYGKPPGNSICHLAVWDQKVGSSLGSCGFGGSSQLAKMH